MSKEKAVVCVNLYINKEEILTFNQAKEAVTNAIKEQRPMRCRNRAGTMLTKNYVKSICLTSKYRTCQFLRP